MIDRNRELFGQIDNIGYMTTTMRISSAMEFCKVFESGAILMFLADKYGGLDTPEKRAVAKKRCHDLRNGMSPPQPILPRCRGK